MPKFTYRYKQKSKVGQVKIKKNKGTHHGSTAIIIIKTREKYYFKRRQIIMKSEKIVQCLQETQI
jgi:hypothetical protein